MVPSERLEGNTVCHRGGTVDEGGEILEKSVS